MRLAILGTRRRSLRLLAHKFLYLASSTIQVTPDVNA